MKESLNSEELSILNEVLREYLTELRGEILDTDDLQYNQCLKRKEEVLRDILSKLEKSRVATFN